jgi:23S rRNA (cytosine1962-C5)-methyltransferase
VRTLTFSKSGLNKLRNYQRELKAADVEESLKPIPPGEWCAFFNSTLNEAWIGFVNPMIDEKFSSIQLLEQISKEEVKRFDPVQYINSKIQKAHEHRSRYKGYEKGCRLIYGLNDGLPGLIVDTFDNVAIIQINTAGLDKFRLEIKNAINKILGGSSVFLDNHKYREKEFLPTFESETIPALKIEENQLSYTIRPEVLQKIGFYYDHRENRIQLQEHLKRLKAKFSRGVDLFSYAGAWGLNALSAGVGTVDFVDQGDFETEINSNLKNNKFDGRGKFIRADVFKFLDDKISKNESYDVILCDPPAFAKSHLQKSQALEGYSKLHRKVMRLANPGSLVCFSSCTHYVTHDDFQKNIQDSAYKENKKIQLIYSGMQGWDHPVSSLDDRSNYIKSYFYLME